MHEHNECKHELKYCEKCDVVYCEKCGHQWTRINSFTTWGTTDTTLKPPYIVTCNTHK